MRAGWRSEYSELPEVGHWVGAQRKTGPQVHFHYEAHSQVPAATLQYMTAEQTVALCVYVYVSLVLGYLHQIEISLRCNCLC